MPVVAGRYGASGPILDVFVGISEPRRRALLYRGLNPPPVLRLQLIIDTGADTTMVNDQHMRSLSIPERGAREILTSTSGTTATRCSTCDVEFKIATYGDAPFVLPALEILGHPLFNHSIDGMIGRDVLDKVILTLDGPRQHFRIDY